MPSSLLPTKSSQLSTRHRKRGSEISRVDVGFHYVPPNLRMIKFHTLFVMGCTKMFVDILTTCYKQRGIIQDEPSLDATIIRFDLSALGKVPGLGAIAAEALIKQVMDAHRIAGEIEGKILLS